MASNNMKINVAYKVGLGKTRIPLSIRRTMSEFMTYGVGHRNLTFLYQTRYVGTKEGRGMWCNNFYS